MVFWLSISKLLPLLFTGMVQHLKEYRRVIDLNKKSSAVSGTFILKQVN